jgi:ATP-dependent DNA helicase RecQ
MEEVTCPKCGFPMVLRTARRGLNVGTKFYGCSRYPICKATVPVESLPNDPQISIKENQPIRETLLSRHLVAREKFENFQVCFFETVAVPYFIYDYFVSEDTPKEILRAFSQWRMDFPVLEYKTFQNEKHSQIISVIEKILNRGRITFPSPKIENEFKEIFKLSSIGFSIPKIDSLAIKGHKTSKVSFWLDSNEERRFYDEILPNLLGRNYKQFVLPQVDISSLLPPDLNGNNMEHQRVDFAIFHPKLDEKIIVEIDGEQHQSQLESDKNRDETLQQYGYTVIRIKANEIQKLSGQQLTFLTSKLSPIKNEFHENSTSASQEFFKLIYSFKLAHQIQVVILHAIQRGFLRLEDNVSWHIISDIDEIDVFNKYESLEILKKSSEDFVELLHKLCKIYSLKLNINKPVCHLASDRIQDDFRDTIYIFFSDKYTTNLPAFYVQNIYFPFHIAYSIFPAPPVVNGLDKLAEEDFEYFLQYLFRKEKFWEGQYDGIIRVLQGKDVLLLLPTGAGKSLVYQLASFLLPGRTIVIDPLISLMEDQIDNLSMIGIDRCIAITSQIEDPQDRNRVMALFGQGEYLFAYIAPERFQTEEFRLSLSALTVHTPVSMIVVDEAHCVSEWGHDFRTAYLNIGRTSRAYCQWKGYIPPLIGLTATASRAVLKDIQRELQIEDFDAIITPKSFDRKELNFNIIFSKSKDKISRLNGYLGQLLPSLFEMSSSSFYQLRGKNTYSGLIFCPHVGGPFGVERVAEEIKKEELVISVAIYSGKEPKFWKPDQYRYHKQWVTKQFKRNKIPLLVCTKAFGMGIDKSNIRYTVHFGLPPSIESFYQEAGRAGRDRKSAHCCIIVSNDDRERSNKLLNPNTKVEEINSTLRNISWEENDDITRILYFHTNSFQGISKERENIEEVLKQLGDVSKKAIKAICIPQKIKEKEKEEGLAREITEKSLHRLLLLGIASDYTINYSRGEFTVNISGVTKEKIIENYGKYVASYIFSRKQIELEKASQLLNLSYERFISEMINLLLHFIYDVIERGRRRALSEMLLACSDSPTDSVFRQRILKYLEATEYTEKLEQIITDQQAGLIKCVETFSTIRSPNEAEELRGQVSRYLESYPDHPALLMLRALSEVFSRERRAEVARENFIASIASALTSYGLSDSIVFDFAAWGILNISNRDELLGKELILELTKSSNPLAAKILIEKLPIKFTKIPAWFLLSKLTEDCSALIFKKGD